jgi:hypothetical protein
VSYVDAGYSIALGALFLYAVALVLRRRRWERARRVAERTMHAEHIEVTEVIAHAAHADHAEEQTAPGARS